MLFRKKGRMIDLRHLQKGSVVSVPSNAPVQDASGYVNLASQKSDESSGDASGAPDFMDDSSQDSQQFSTQEDGYNKREVDAKMTELDNKIYRLEQRVELLERKAGVGSSSQSGNLIGW